MVKMVCSKSILSEIDANLSNKDPWTPPSRVERLVDFSDNVERVIALKNAGHCPHGKFK